jgi:hypothetical protein
MVRNQLSQAWDCVRAELLRLDIINKLHTFNGCGLVHEDIPLRDIDWGTSVTLNNLN